MSGDPEYRYTKYLKQPRKTDDDNYDDDEYVDFEAPIPAGGYITEKLYLLKPLKEFHIEEKYALDLRQKALDGEIALEEYTELIRK